MGGRKELGRRVVVLSVLAKNLAGMHSRLDASGYLSMTTRLLRYSLKDYFPLRLTRVHRHASAVSEGVLLCDLCVFAIFARTFLLRISNERCVLGSDRGAEGVQAGAGDDACEAGWGCAG